MIELDIDNSQIEVETRSAVYGPDFRFNDDTSDFVIDFDLRSRLSFPGVGDFRVLPYQTSPTTDGMTLTWFSATPTNGEIQITGTGLNEPLILTTTPQILPVLDYQIAAELGDTRAASPFTTTAVRTLGGELARNFKHRVVVTGLLPGE
ncbi:MAG: hypothetical protein HC927_03945, partial [Deltaproteobacteria bacterium]|nr:hypothetical protein [Deltaproteobacteria bacterium]